MTVRVTLSTDNATFPKSSSSINSNSSVPIQIQCISHFEFAPRDTEKSEYFDVVDFGSAASTVSVDTVIVFSGNYQKEVFSGNHQKEVFSGNCQKELYRLFRNVSVAGYREI